MKTTPSTLRTMAVALAPCLLLALPCTWGCEDDENFLEGSLDSQYDLSFDEVEATQFIQSRQLLVEYVRGGDEKPMIVTIVNPDGPGTFDYDAHEVNFSSSLPAGSGALPDVTSATVELEVFTPEVIDSEVEGAIHAMFTNAGTGDAFSLEGAFLAPLQVQP